MNGNGARNFTYLNRDGRRPGFSAQGLSSATTARGSWHAAAA